MLCHTFFTFFFYTLISKGKNPPKSAKKYAKNVFFEGFPFSYCLLGLVTLPERQTFDILLDFLNLSSLNWIM